MLQRIISLTVIILFSCRPLVTTFDNIENATYYQALEQDNAVFNGSLKVMTWNIRFGAGRLPWFGDSCGDRILMTELEVTNNMNAIVQFINQEKPDILLIQEIDQSSKRSAYMNQIQFILNNTHFNYGVYSSMWDVEFIPSDGIGKIDAGNAILSRWEITNAVRIKLPLRTDQDDLTQYFYLRRNIIKAKISLPDIDSFYVVNIHATAFSTDDTKHKHIDKYKEILEDLHSQNLIFVTGGDLNSVPPGTPITDFCMDDICNDESFHTDSDGGPHREGSYFNNFEGEPDLVQPFYDSYFEAINLERINISKHFTHSPWNTSSDTTEYWDRKLDYLFTNYHDWSPTGETHNSIQNISDHAPVSAILTFP